MNDREIILGTIEEYFKEQIKCRMAVTANAITDLLTSHGVTVQKHSRWVENACFDQCFWVCSNCKFPSQAIAAPKLYNYCPNCGAKMDGEADG